MASSRIKGITVEIGGDVSGLDKALKDVNKSINYIQNDLKDVDKLLKLDPTNTQLLAQKQKLLQQAVEETKAKLKELKQADKQAKDQLESGDLGQDKYDALQREIIETENNLKALQKQARESATVVQEIAAVGTKFQEAGGKVESVGKSLLPLSTAVAGVGVTGIKVASDFEKAMSGVQAITGATEEDFEKLRETAIDLGATTSFSSGEVAEAMTEMAKAGWSTKQIIDGMAGVLDATAASGENLGTVSTIVADAITGFGLEAKDSARVADLLTQAANSGTIGVYDLGESYKYVAPVAQSMGLTIEDVTTALSAMSMANIKGSQAGTSLRTVLANMVKPSDTVAAAMDDLNLSITNSDGSFKSLDEIIAIIRTSFSGLTDDQKAYYATALAGKEGMSGLLSLLNLTQEEYDAMSASMNNCSGVAGEAASIMQDNLQSKVEQLGGALESLAIKLSEHVIPFLTGLVEKITEVVDSFTNLNPETQKLILIIGGIIAAAGPLLIMIGNVITAVGTIMKVTPKIAEKISSFGTVVSTVLGGIKTVVMGLFSLISAHPVIAIVTAIIATITLLWTKCEWFREAVIAIWNTIKDTASNIWNGIKDFFTGLWDGISSTAQAAWNGIKDFFAGLWDGLSSTAQTVWNGVKDFFKGLWDGISSAAQAAWNGISDFLVGLWDSISSTAQNAWNAIKAFFSAVWESIKSIVKTAAQAVYDDISAKFEACRQIISTIFDTIKSIIKTAWDTIKSVFSTVLEAIKSTVSRAFTSMWDGIKNTVSDIVDAIRDGFNAAVDFIKDLASSAFSWGADIIKGIVDGIKSCIGKVKDAVTSVAETIRSFLHFSVPDEGPLTDYESWMPDFMGGLAKGIQANTYKVEDAVNNLAGKMAGVSGDMSLYATANGTNITVAAPDVTVLLGNENFKAFVVKTAQAGIGNNQINYSRAKGRS